MENVPELAKNKVFTDFVADLEEQGYYIFWDNKIQQLSRYDKYPPVGLLLEKGEDTDEQDIKIITDIYQHHTFNSKDAFRFTKLTSDPLEEVVDEINRV